MASAMTRQLPFAFADPTPLPARVVLAPGALLLRGFLAASTTDEADVLAGVEAVAATAPFRHMTTPGGLRMSVAMTSCGAFGWVSDEGGYRYTARDPERAAPWPAMPDGFLRLARAAANEAGYPGFEPDACLVNRYVPEARMTLHQDKDERDFGAPIVSVSLGLPATFLFGGATRAVRPTKIPLVHGDVVVWGGPSRLFFHGVAPLAPGCHAQLGATRINLTFRRAH